MISNIWKLKPQEVYQYPYDYESQNLFIQEAEYILSKLFNELIKYSGIYTINDKTKEKAIWMLQLDALDTLNDCLILLKNNNFRIAGRLFRDIIETLDLAAYFSFNTEESHKNLKRWFNDEIIQNSVYRNFLKNENIKLFEMKREHYRMISKINHRTYFHIGSCYIRGQNDLMLYASTNYFKDSIPPHNRASYLSLLADLIMIYINEMLLRNILKLELIEIILKEAFKEDQVPNEFNFINKKYE